MDHDEPHWRINSGFSPPPLIWDFRLQSDGLPYGSQVGAPHGSSLSTNSRGSRSMVGSDRCSNHHHSVSDGVLSYSGSPPDNFQLPQWTSPTQKFNAGSVSQFSRFPRSSERRYAIKAASPSFGSPPSFSESSHLGSTSKQAFSFNNCSFPSRWPHISKAVYPLVYHNPISDCEQFGDAENNSVGRLTPSEAHLSPFHWPDNSSNVSHKFHKTLSELQRSEASPDPGASSRREGFRWSSASSYDLGLDGERFDIVEHVHAENLRSPVGRVADQKCGVCGKLLWQKWPWSSHRIMRGGDMPTTGVLSCSHVFHAECLEQVTPKSQICDPPCVVCLKTAGLAEESSSVLEPLEMALRSLRRRRGVIISEALENDEASNHMNLVAPRWNESGGSSMKDRLKKHFTFKGKESRDIFSRKVFQKVGSSSGKEALQRRLPIE